MAINVKDKLITLESLGLAFNEEKELRQEADNALSARIDNIIAPEGDASLDEVVNARTGHDGTVYSTLKNRLDTEYTTVDSSLNSSSTNPVQNMAIKSAIDSLSSIVSENTSDIELKANASNVYTKSEVDSLISGVSGSSTITGLSDTNISNVSDGQVLTYDSSTSKWVNETPTLEVVETYAELAGTTADRVLVLNNESSFGDGGYCFFEARSGETQRTIARTDGTYVAPMLNQSDLPDRDIDYHWLIDTAEGYIGNSDISYGNDYTLFDTTCTTEIDCSAFVCAVLQGITYANSRYTLGTAEANVLGESSMALPDGNRRIGALNTGELANYFGQHKCLYEVPDDIDTALRTLKFGDILFVGSDSSDYATYYRQIDHVVIVLGTIPERNFISYMQVGGGGTASNEDTAGKTSYREIGSSYPITHFKCFARPIYTNIQPPETNTIKLVDAGSLVYDVRLIPNMYVAPSTGIMANSATHWADPKYYPVTEGRTLTCNEPDSDIVVHAVFYDADYDYISVGRVDDGVDVPANAKYARFNGGFSAVANKIFTLALAEQLVIKMSADATTSANGLMTTTQVTQLNALGDLDNLDTTDKSSIVAAINEVANSGGGGGSSTLTGLTDTSISNVSDGQILTYDSSTSKWVNETPSDSSIVDLTDTGEAIPSNADLNDYITAGKYACPNATVAATLSNCPSSVGFSLYCLRQGGLERAFTQLLITNASSDVQTIYYRMVAVTSGGAYSSSTSWKELIIDAGVTSVNGSTGAVTIPDATTAANGLMTSSDKSKLDGIEANADSTNVTQTLTSGTVIGSVNGVNLYAPSNSGTSSSIWADKKVVIFGDSVGAGYNNDDYSFTNVLSADSFFNSVTRNCVSGSTSITLYTRMQESSSDLADADIVYCEYQYNDIVGLAAGSYTMSDVISNVRTAITYLRNINDTAQIVWLPITVTNFDKAGGATNSSYYETWCNSMLPVFAELGIAVLPIYDTLTSGHASSDGKHPNTVGHQLIAELIEQNPLGYTIYSTSSSSSSSGTDTSVEVIYDGNATIQTYNGSNYIALSNISDVIAVGDLYKVTWGDTATMLTAQSITISGTDYIVIGNPGVAGGTDDGSGLTYVAYKYNSTTLQFLTTEATGTKYVKVEKYSMEEASTTSAGLMSAEDKTRLDTLWADYSSAITALGVS